MNLDKKFALKYLVGIFLLGLLFGVLFKGLNYMDGLVYALQIVLVNAFLIAVMWAALLIKDRKG